MTNPKLAARSCNDCWKYVYNEQTGEPEKRGGLPILRNGSMPDCRVCPKESPQRAHLHELSDRNRRALSAYLQSKAVGFRNLTPREAADPLLQQNFATIENVIESVRAARNGKNIALTFAAMFSGKK